MACSPAMTPAANLRLEHPPHEEHDRLACAADDALRAGQYERARELYAAAATLVTERLLTLASRRRQLRELVGAELPRLLAFATLACGLQVAASDVVADMLAELDDDAILSAPRPGEELLARLLQHLQQVFGRKASVDVAVLEDALRAGESLPIDVRAPPISGDLSRVPILLAELKRTCLTAALECLPLARRLAFLLDLFGYSAEEAASLLRTQMSALQPLLRRGVRQLEDYLGPRCGHLNPSHFCSCSGRLGVALATGFVRLPIVRDAAPPAAEPTRDLASLYRSILGAGLKDPGDVLAAVPLDRSELYDHLAAVAASLWQRAAHAQALADLA